MDACYTSHYVSLSPYACVQPYHKGNDKKTMLGLISMAWPTLAEAGLYKPFFYHRKVYVTHFVGDIKRQTCCYRRILLASNRSSWMGACNCTIFLSRRFHRPIYFRSNFPGMRLPWERHDQSQETYLTSLRHSLDRNCLSFTKEKIY